MAVTKPTPGSIQAAYEDVFEVLPARTDSIKPDEGKAYEHGWKDGFDEGYASADDWIAQHEDAMREHGWIRAGEGTSGKLIETIRAMERSLRTMANDVRELSMAAYELDGNAATVHNQRAELAKLNALRAEDAQTIRQLRRELEEARHGSE